MRRRVARPGTTLVELLTVLLILGIAGAVAIPAWRTAPTVAAESEDEAVRRLRMAATRSGAPVADTVALASGLAIITVWPNGLVLVDSATIARSGAPRRADVH